MFFKKITLNSTLFLGLILLLSSCEEPQDIHLNYSQDSLVSGSIYLVPDRPTALTFVEMNDEIILENGYVKSITIHAVPEGEHLILYSSGDPNFSKKLYEKIFLSIGEGASISRVVKVPPYSEGYWTKLGLSDLSGSIYYAAGIIYLAVLLL